MYYYLDTVLRLWHFTGAEREAREFRRKLVYKTGFCMRYLLRADRPRRRDALFETTATTRRQRWPLRGERRALRLVAAGALRRGAGAKCQRRRARIASRRRRRVGRELRPVGVRPPRADATELLLSPRGRALEEASRASGLGLPGDGITGPCYGFQRGHGRELQRHGPMSRARGTIYVLGFNAQYAFKTCQLAL